MEVCVKTSVKRRKCTVLAGVHYKVVIPRIKQQIYFLTYFSVVLPKIGFNKSKEWIYQRKY